MFYKILMRLFYISLFFIWCLVVVNFAFASLVTFIIFSVSFVVFLFCFNLTLFGWCISLLPILKFVFVPWYSRRCHVWTKTEKKKQRSIAFFHPYANGCGDQERVLWVSIDSILKKHSDDTQIIVYTGHVYSKPHDILQSVKQHFNIDLNVHEPSITFIHLSCRFMVEVKYLGVLASLGRTFGSIVLGLESLIRFIPDVYVDSCHYIFIYPFIHYLASIPIVSYIHSSVINNAILNEINSEHTRFYDNNELMTLDTLLNKLNFIVNQIWVFIHGWCVRRAKIIHCNSLWTKAQIESLWDIPSIYLAYPPCDIKKLLEIPFINDDEQQTMKTIISMGHFRQAANHELQIRAFHDVFQREQDCRQQLKLVLIGSVKDSEDQEYLERLRSIVNDLNISQEVIFRVNINFEELKSELNHALIGLHSKEDDSFALDIVKMMAAGLVVIGHNSGAPKTDIIDEEKTGFLASDIDSYATAIRTILRMTTEERQRMREQARANVDKFSILNFEQSFMEPFEKIILLK